MPDKIELGDWVRHVPSGTEAQVLAIMPDDLLGIDAERPTFYKVKDCRRKSTGSIVPEQRKRAREFYKLRGAIAGPWAK